MTKRILGMALALVTSQLGIAQIQTISFTDNYTFPCGTSMVISDDNGGGAGSTETDTQLPYSCQNFTVTICPDQPGQGIRAEFLAFDLQNNVNPNNADYLNVFDADVVDPAFQVGSSSGTGYNGTVFVASTNNPTGCLTFQFVCNSGNASGAQGFVFELSCVQPCATPTSSVALASLLSFPDNPQPFEGNPQSVGMCPEEPVFFDASASVSQPGFNLENITWNWGDGTSEFFPFATGAVASHEYVVPGEYIVTAVVEDDNGCPSVNLQPFQLLVSTFPVFNTTIDTPICTDVIGVGNGNPVQSISWTALPPTGESSSEPIPDQTGVPFASSLTINFFDPDQTLDDCEDLISLTANMEHSFLADLTMWVECPNGTQVILMENEPNGGLGLSGCIDNNSGGWYLGEPDDGDGIDPNPGVGYDYTWSMDGDWVINDAENPNTSTPPGATFPTTVDPGLYLPCGDLCDLEGCPLNGNWQFVVLDQYGGDNGFVFEWEIEFDPSILPDVTTFEPVIGLESDSSFWNVAGLPEIISTSNNGNTIEYLYDTPGTYDLEFSVTNNFGCKLDTVVAVEVIANPGTDLTVGADQVWCNAAIPVQLEATLGNTSGVTAECGGVAGVQTYCYGNLDNTVFTYCPDNPGDGTRITLEFLQGLIEAGFDQIEIFDGPDTGAPSLGEIDGDIAGQFFEACNSEGCLTIQFSSDFTESCIGNGLTEAQWEIACTGATSSCSYDWEWGPAQYLDNSLVPNPSLTNFGSEPVDFTVSVSPVGLDNCAATGTITVSPAFNYEVEQQQPSCFANDGVIGVEIFENALAPEGPFTIELYTNEPAGPVLMDQLVWDNITDFYYDDLVPGDYTVVVFNGNNCVYNQNILLEDPLPLTLNVPSNQTICLGGTATLFVNSDDDPLNVWTYEWDNGLPNGNEQPVSPNTSTVYTVQAFDPNGCPTPSYSVGVSVLDAINADLVADDFLCSGEEAFLDAGASNGGSGAGYTYTWTFEGGLLNEDDPNIFTFPPSSGTYCVTVGDDCETPPSTTCTEVVLESPVPIAFSVDTTEACGTGTFLFTNETDPASISGTLWAFGDGTYAGESNTVKTFENPGFYDVGVTVTSQAGGCEYTLVQEAYINVYPIPDVGYFAGPQPTRAPDTEITFDGYSNANVVEWLWTFNVFAPLGTSTEQDPVFQFPNGGGGTYPVQLQITDAQGCVNVVTRDVVIQDFFNLYVPNTFTPNNDGTNDAFFVEGSDIDPDRFELEVWNRWGELVWRTTDPEDAWYGQVGEEGQHFVPNGPYSYRLEVHSLDVESFRKEVFGVVTIIR